MQTLSRTVAGSALAAVLALAGLGVAPQQAQATTTRTLVAIGDSYPAGDEGNTHRAYPEWTARWTSTSSVHLVTHNLAHGGWTTGDVLHQFDHTDALRQIAAADTVVITIGANDVLYANEDPRGAAHTMWGYMPSVDHATSNLDAILKRVRAARHGDVRRVVVADYNTIYRQGGAARWAGPTFITGSNMVTRSLNNRMTMVCKRYGMKCVDVYPYFQGSNVDSLVTSDGTHPSLAGHQLYAHRIVASLPRR